ncbi:MAG: Asp-tRNA(Asn)/Glu-tRNA(Gln) amidotransferase subunit GatA [Proteobacteria bacterium]|nr:Asp-tRNA(Asn)/Glu-tRNA(Gln) amidotransferase subunit GatA [Pseudomonadota bacterium]
MTEMLRWSASEALAKLANGEVSSVELTKAVLARVEGRNAEINAYITVSGERALAMAAASDARRKAAKLSGKAAGALEGLPIAVKDLYCTAGIRTTAGSKILDNFVPAYESTVSGKLWDAGAVCVGKLNMDEFAMGGSGENSAYGVARNPWDTTRVPGGSSSGSSAAVADFQCFMATGSDTGGSIRQPASMTGIVGIKPTYGRCSRYGMVAFASSLDQAGAMARTVEDAARMMQVIAGHDPKDSTSSPQAVPDWLGGLDGLNVKGLRIGLPKEYFIDGMDARVRGVIMDAVKKFEAAGAVVKEIRLPSTEFALAAYYIVAPAEAASNLARYDGMRYGLRVEGKNLLETYIKSRSAGFGDEPKRRIMVGNYVLSSGYYDAYYHKAMQVRTLLVREFAAAFEQVDVIMTPTAPNPAFKIGEKVSDPVALYLEDAFTVTVNMAGLPGISVPAGVVEDRGVKLPVGLQIIGRHWDEAGILRVGRAWEKLRGEWSPPQ